MSVRDSGQASGGPQKHSQQVCSLYHMMTLETSPPPILSPLVPCLDLNNHPQEGRDRMRDPQDFPTDEPTEAWKEKETSMKRLMSSHHGTTGVESPNLIVLGSLRVPKSPGTLGGGRCQDGPSLVSPILLLVGF